MILDYPTIYRLIEEIQVLRGARLRAVFSPLDTLFILEFQKDGAIYLLHFSLDPAKPALVCEPLKTGKKLKRVVSPPFNFLKAHFVGLPLTQVLIAEKPDRTVKMIFEDVELIFRCYPHRAQLELIAKTKRIVWPYYRDFKPEMELSFVEPEPVGGWTENSKIDLGRTPEKAVPRDLLQHRLKKVDQAMAKIESIHGHEYSREQELIEKLKRDAENAKIKSPEDVGSQLEKIYDQISKIKKKGEVRLERLRVLKQQKEDLQARPHLVSDAPTSSTKKTKISKFSGLTIELPSGLRLWVGRNAAQNDELVKKAQSFQVWIHLRDEPGAHGLILISKNQKASDSDVEFACQVVAQLSRRTKKSFEVGEKIDFLVVPKKFVKKPKGAKPGQVVVERETVRRVAYRSVRFHPVSS